MLTMCCGLFVNAEYLSCILVMYYLFPRMRMFFEKYMFWKHCGEVCFQHDSHVYTSVDWSGYMLTHPDMCACVLVYIYMCTCIYIYIYVCIYTHTKYIYMCVWVCICIYTDVDANVFLTWFLYMNVTRPICMYVRSVFVFIM